MALKAHFMKLADWFSDKDFTRENLLSLFAEMKEKNLKPSYCNKLITVCKYISQYYKVSSFDNLTYFRESKGPPKEILTPEEMKALADVKLVYGQSGRKSDFINLRQKALIMLLSTTGCRIGEALELTYENIFSTPPHVIFTDTKNGEDRTVPIAQTIYDLLMSIPKRHNLIFRSGRNGPLGLQEVNLDLKRRALTVGIKKRVWCHLFRHSFATIMRQQGVDSIDLSKICGWRDPKSAMRYDNSLLDHFVSIIYMNPLLKHAMTPEMMSQKVRKQISQSVDPSRFPINITEDKNLLIVEIRKS